jgi:beta-lactamase class A
MAGLLPRGSHEVVVSVGGRTLADRRVRGRSFDFRVELPRREVTVRIEAVGAGARAVDHVVGLPSAARPWEVRMHGARALAARLRELVRAFPGRSAVYVADLGTGTTADVEPRLPFPAASTLKLAIAVKALRELAGKPVPGSRVDALLRSMLLESDNDAANSLEVLLGGSTRGGGRRIDETLDRLGLDETDIYGGYARSLSSAYVPVHGKHTTAYDLARLWIDVHLAAEGKGLRATTPVSSTRATVRPSSS